MQISPWDNPGSYVRPDIVLAVLRMCREAGAKAIGVFKELGSGYWKRSGLAEKFRDEIQGIAYIGGDYTEVAIPRGRSLKKADVAKALLDRDVFINIPIAKDHTGLGFTGTRFADQTRQENQYTMVDRKQEYVMIKQTGHHIAIVIGSDAAKVQSISERLVEKLQGA